MMRYSLRSSADAAKLREDILSDVGFGVGMYAVAQPEKGGPFEFRILEIDQKSQTRDFDRDVVSGALEEYSAEDVRYTTFTDALDLRGSAAVLSASDYLGHQPGEGEGGDDAVGLLPSFLRALPNLPKMFGRGELENLEPSDFPNVKGILFSYQFGDAELYGYQKVTPSALLRESSFLLRIKSGRAFELFTDESIKIANRFDFIVIDDQIISLKPSTLVGQFGLLEVRKRQALNAVDTIGEYIADLAVIVNRIEAERTRTITKVLRIKESPVIAIDRRELRRRLESSAEYKGKFRFGSDDKIIVETNAEAVDALKMLNDELVKSPITNVVYESEIKARVS